MQIGGVLWDQGFQRPQLPQVSGELDCDLCVVGLGANGLTAVLAAAQAGLSVVGIDADRLAAGAGGRNGGLLLAGIADFHHNARKLVGDKKAAQLYQQTLDELDWIEKTTPNSVTRNGALRLAHDEVELKDCQAHFDALIEDGFPVEWYEGTQGQGLLITSDGVFHPIKRVLELAKLAQDAGAKLFTHSPALSIDPGVVTTPNGKINAKNILVASDGSLHKIFPELQNQLRPVRLQMIGTSPATQVNFEHAVYVRDGWDYWQQLPDGRIAIGGGRDLSLETEFTDENTPTEFIRNYLSSRLQDLNVNAQVEFHWSAIVSYTNNDLPIAQEVRPNVYAIGGYCGTGNVVGSLLARAVVEKISTGQSNAYELFRSA